MKKILSFIAFLIVSVSGHATDSYNILDKAFYPTTYGTAGQCWISGGSGVVPSWASCITGAVPVGPITTSGLTMSTAKMLGRATASTGAIEEISVTGSGSAVLATSPTLVTPILGSASSTTLVVGDQGAEGGGINIGGVTYDSSFKVSDIDGTNFAQTILHRHSTILEPLIVGARSNSNTSAHAAVTNGMNVFTVYGAGWTAGHYDLFGQISMAAADGGTINGTSAPGQMIFAVTKNGEATPTAALTLKPNSLVGSSGVSAHFANDLFINSTTFRVGKGSGSGADNSVTGSYAGAYMTNGYRNSLFGKYAGVNVTTGYSNSAFGADALQGVVGGYGNIGIGDSAGIGVQGGNNNILIGNSAGGNITSGSGTVIIGGALGSASLTDTIILATGGGTERLTIDSTGRAYLGTTSGTEIGFRIIPQVSKSADYTTVIGDSGKHIFHPSSDNNARTFTIDSNANVPYPIGTAITFVNMSIASINISITSDTIYLAGTGTTGTRTLTQYGNATAIKISSTEWIISGAGLL